MTLKIQNGQAKSIIIQRELKVLFTHCFVIMIFLSVIVSIERIEPSVGGRTVPITHSKMPSVKRANICKIFLPLLHSISIKAKTVWMQYITMHCIVLLVRSIVCLIWFFTSQSGPSWISQYNAVPLVRLELATSRYRVNHSTTEPLRSPSAK